MKFALALDDQGRFYRYNPCGADRFAIYTVHKEQHALTYALLKNVPNPWHDILDEGCSDEMRMGSCEVSRQQDMGHKIEHYALLEALSRCEYLLGNRFCDNTKNAMHNAGIKAFNVPPFLKDINKIITHFLIGVNIADSSGNIHHAS